MGLSTNINMGSSVQAQVASISHCKPNKVTLPKLDYQDVSGWNLRKLQRDMQRNISLVTNSGPSQSICLEEMIEILYRSMDEHSAFVDQLEIREAVQRVDSTDMVTRKHRTKPLCSLSDMAFLLIFLYYNIRKSTSVQLQRLWGYLCRIHDAKVTNSEGSTSAMFPIVITLDQSACGD